MRPSCVKPCVKRGKTDAADGEHCAPLVQAQLASAICEAVTRPGMRFVPVKTEEQQAVPVAHNTRDSLVRQLTQIANSIRAHVGEFGLVAPTGVHNVEALIGAGKRANCPLQHKTSCACSRPSSGK